MLNNDIQSNPKSLWSFIKINRCYSTGVVPLLKGLNNDSGSLEKVNFLKDQLTSVFTEEDTTNVSTICPSPFPDLEQIEIHPNGIKSISLKSKQCNKTTQHIRRFSKRTTSRVNTRTNFSGFTTSGTCANNLERCIYHSTIQEGR